MICPSCSNENDDNRRYCGQCGTNLRPICVRCGFANRAPDHYCGGCGSEIQLELTQATAPRPAAVAPVAAKPNGAAPRPANAPAPARAPNPAPAAKPNAAPPAAVAPAKPAAPPPTPPAAAAAPPSPAPTPAPATAPTPAPAKAVGGPGLISNAELALLIDKPKSDESKVNLPEGRITQNDLDGLFEGPA